MVERRHQAVRDTKRQARIAEINAVKETLPQGAFLLPVEKLDISDEMIEALQPLSSVGEIMLRFLIDEQRIARLLEHLPPDSTELLQAALDQVVIPDIDELEAVEEEEEAAAEPEAQVAEPETGEEVVRDAFADEPVPAEVVAPGAPKKFAPPRREEPGTQPDEEEDEDVDLVMAGKRPGGKGDKKKKKKERQQRRQLIFDEEIGQVIAKRRRKGGRGGQDWGDEE
jgi:hypothetical protein